MFFSKSMRKYYLKSEDCRLGNEKLLANFNLYLFAYDFKIDIFTKNLIHSNVKNRDTWGRPFGQNSY